MSEFSNINKLICTEIDPSQKENDTKDPCKPQPQEISESDIWYDSQQKRYYAVQSYTNDKEFLSSSKYTSEQENIIFPQIAQAAKDRIISYFNLEVPGDVYSLAEGEVEKVTVSDRSNVPVKFLIYYSKDSLGMDKKTKNQLDLESKVFKGAVFFGLLKTLHNKLKLYSRYQSVLFTFDKIKITKEDGKPFYLNLVAERLLSFTTELKKFFALNNVDTENMGDIKFFLEVSGSQKKIVDMIIDNENKKQHNNNLTIGTQEFLGHGFLQDEDMVNFILNINEITSGNASWIDLVIEYGSGLKIDTGIENILSAVPCFPDFDFNFDINLDLDFNFSEKLEYLFHKKNSFSLEDAFRTQTVLIPDLGASIDFDGLLDSTFDKLRETTSTFEVLDFDNPFKMLEDSLKNYSFEDGFDQLYQFLGIESFTIMMNKLLVNFQKMSDAADMITMVIDTFMQNLDYDATILILERIPSNKRFELLEELKNLYSANLNIDLDIDLDIEEFVADYAENLKDQSLEQIKEIIKEFLNKNPAIDVFSDLPEFQKIAQVFNLLTSVNIDIATPLDLLSNFAQDQEVFVFSEKLFKIPNFPDIPSFKFSIVEFIQKNLFIILKKAVSKIITIIIQKLVGFIQNFITDGLTNSRPQGNEGDYNITDGLGQFISRFLCDDDPEDILEEHTVEEKEPEDTKDALLKQIVPNLNISDESYLKLAEVIGSNSTVSDIIDAVTEDDEVGNKNFINSLTEAIQAEAPEFNDFFKDNNDTKTMFRNIRNFISPQTLNTLRNFNNTYQDTPFATTYCLKKDDRERWIDDKRAGLQEAGFTGEAAKKHVDDKLEEIKDNTSDILDLTVNGFQDRLFDTVEDILGGAEDIIDGGPQEECEDLYASEVAKEIIKESREEKKQTENLMLEKVSSAFVEDLTRDTYLSVFHNKGILSRVMSDKFGRSMSEVKFIKESPIMFILLQLGIIPKPEFPNTIGNITTKKLRDGLTYSSTNAMTTFGTEGETPFSAFFKNILYLREAKPIKQADLTISAPTTQRAFPDITETLDTIDIKYIDYKDPSERQFEYYIEVDGEMLINSRLEIPQDILESYPEILDLNKNEFINVLMSGPISYTQNNWRDDNKVIFSDDMISAMGFADEINFGYPNEAKRQDLDSLWEAFETDGIDAVVEGIEHIQVLDPETYGTFFGKPKLHASPQKTPEGYFKDSQEFYNKKTDKKLDRTVLKLDSIRQFIDDYSEKLDKSKFAKASPESLIDSPFFKVDDERKLANSQGMVKAYIRSYLVEHVFLAYNVWKNVGFDLDTTTMASYIYENLMKENKNIKTPKKGVYNEFVTYILMLMSNAEAYINFNDDELATELKDIDDNYESLQPQEIEFIKNNPITKFNKKYENYTLGYHGIAFQEKYKSIYNNIQIIPLISAGMTSNEIRFANKIGHALQNIEVLEQAFLRTVEGEVNEFKNIYPSNKNIYLEFLKVLTKEDALFEVDAKLDESGWSTSSYYILKRKNEPEKIMSKDDLITELESIPEGQRTTSNISELYGDAELTEDKESYEGTIGIKYGVGIYFREQPVAVFSEDVKDMLISEFLTDLNNSDNYNSEIIDHDCFVRNLLKTPESRIILDLAFQVKKLPTMLSIYYIENLTSSINHGESDGGDKEYEIEIPINPLALQASFLNFVATKAFGRTGNLLETKKEIKETFLSNYIRKYYDPPLGEDRSFFDFKILESLQLSIDHKNFAVDNLAETLTGLGNAPSLLQRFSFVEDLELDEKGLPIMNKFLSNFKEE